MPVISRFYGISIMMYFHDHSPPHIHAKYEGEICIVNIQTIEISSGNIAKNAKRMILEWVTIHQNELLENWKHAQSDEKILLIEPLK
ncbi:DUF4160 domain-containing protein [Candidatus Peregrinibacteria bacterium]|jgi:hypothetical protein|nr:DUF4160 domain-containing protein [Candidatus Peregrinibacteria bacterium]